MTKLEEIKEHCNKKNVVIQEEDINYLTIVLGESEVGIWCKETHLNMCFFGEDCEQDCNFKLSFKMFKNLVHVFTRKLEN